MIDGKRGAPFARTPKFNNRTMLRSAIAGALAAGALATGSVADARIVSVQLSAPTVAFGGYSWPGVGQYHKITGVAYAEVDPGDPRNAIIVDINLAQPQATPNVPGVSLGSPGRTASGKVAYLLNFYILKPVSLAAVDPKLNGYGKVFYEPPNRGGKTWTALGRVSGGGNDPATITNTTVLQNSFLMPRGYTLVWSGWEPLVPAANLGTSLTASVALPIAVNPNGSTITGPVYEYGSGGVSLNYTPASTDKANASLTHRVHLQDPEELVDPSLWNYNAQLTGLTLTGGFVPNDIYEFRYIGKDPEIMGLGFAAVRDLVSWVKYGSAAEGNPVPDYVSRVYTEISSQPGRMFNDFRHLGFNEDESGRKVFDGHMQWISAGSGINMNYRFSQSNRTERNRQDHRYPENLFPFASVSTTDPYTGITDSRYARCQATATNTCPLAVEIYSANEYWVKSASLLHTTPDGSTDLPDSPYTRNYFMSSMQHGTGGAANRGNCQQFQNPLSSSVTQRALFLALDAWSTDSVPPPNSRVPKLADSTMTVPSQTGFPLNIPDPFGETPNGKVTYTGLKSTRFRWNMGADFYTTGIPTINPPVVSAGNYQFDPVSVPFVSPDGHPVYPSFVPKTDSDGNDIAGLRLPDVTVPVATYTGWALRRGAQANDGCEGSGQWIPFAPTADERAASGDPRPSVAERYPTFDDYDTKIKAAMNAMIQDRTLLCEDSVTELQRLRTLGSTRGVPNPPSSFPPYSFALANSSIASTPPTLWPPNGKMVPVSLAPVAPDTCNVSCNITGITGTDGANASDWQITGAMTANLRSERSGKSKAGRTYTVQLACTDPATTLSSTKTVAITVPHDQGKR